MDEDLNANLHLYFDGIHANNIDFKWNRRILCEKCANCEIWLGENGKEESNFTGQISMAEVRPEKMEWHIIKGIVKSE
jgi:hypothetical protein